MRFGKGIFLKNLEDSSYGIVVDVDTRRERVTVFQFGPTGPQIRVYVEYDAESVFETVE